MIAEKFPELKGLSPQEQLILAGELWSLATASDEGHAGLTSEAVSVMEERLDQYLKHPETGISWADLQAKAQELEDR